MIEAIQFVCAYIGKWGCYFLCIIRLAEKLASRPYDALLCYTIAVAGKFMRPTCWVENPGGLLGSLVGGEWLVLKAGNGKDSAGKDYDLPLDYQLAQGEFGIDRYEVVGETEGHFILPDGWDPYGKSRTVRDGRLVSRRIFRRMV